MSFFNGRKAVFLAPNLRVQSTILGKAWHQRAGDVTPIVRELKKMKNAGAQFTSFFSFTHGAQPVGLCCPYLG